jgi:hypothetical protein
VAYSQKILCGIPYLFYLFTFCSIGRFRDRGVHRHPAPRIMLWEFLTFLAYITFFVPMAGDHFPTSFFTFVLLVRRGSRPLQAKHTLEHYYIPCYLFGLHSHRDADCPLLPTTSGNAARMSATFLPPPTPFPLQDLCGVLHILFTGSQTSARLCNITRSH